MKCGFYTPVKQKGFTTFDSILLFAIMAILITYIVLISIFPYDEYIKNKQSNINNQYVNNLNIANNIIGIILGLLISIFISDVVLREIELSIYINIFAFIISTIIMVFYYVSVGYNTNTDWLKYNYAILPFMSSLFLLFQFSFIVISRKLYDVYYPKNNIDSNSSDIDSIIKSDFTIESDSN